MCIYFQTRGVVCSFSVVVIVAVVVVVLDDDNNDDDDDDDGDDDDVNLCGFQHFSQGFITILVKRENIIFQKVNFSNKKYLSPEEMSHRNDLLLCCSNSYSKSFLNN